MTDHEKENLREELLELEGMLLQCREKADKIKDAYGLKFVSIDLMRSEAFDVGKIAVQIKCGIYEAAEVLGKPVKICKRTFSGPENAEFTSRGCGWVQLPVYDTARYRRIGE